MGGRSARRQQQRAERRAARKQGSQSPSARGRSISPSAPTVTDARPRGSFFKPRWAMDIISELHKVTWPSRHETAHLTMVVVLVSVLIGALLGAADIGFSWFVERTILP